MMFKEKYNKMNSGIAPSRQLVDKVTAQCGQQEQRRGRNNRFFRRPVIIAAVVLVLMLNAVPVLASNSPTVYNLMRLVSPQVAQFFMPVQKSCEYDGIKMEVVSVDIHNDTANIYVTMQDLSHDRIDETADLYDSYTINTPRDSVAYCEMIGFDKDNKTATFLINIQSMDGKELVGDKVTFSVRNLLSNKQVYDKIPIEFDLTTAEENADSRVIVSTGGGGPAYDKYAGGGEPLVLVPQEPLWPLVEGIEFTGAGYIDGLLHLQTAVADNLKKDNHGEFYMKKQMEASVSCDYNVYTRETLADGTEMTYVDYVFDIPKEELSSYELYGSFVTSGLFLEGDWQVTFKIK